MFDEKKYRKSHFAGALLALALCLSCGCLSLPKVKEIPPKLSPQETLDAFAAKYLEKTGNNAVAIAALFPNDRTYFACAGENTGTNTIFALASLTKDFTYFAAQNAYRQGKLDLDAPVGSCTERPLPEEFAAVTLRDLLEHRSGLPREIVLFRDLPEVLDAWLFGGGIYSRFSTREGLFKTICLAESLRAIRKHEPMYSNVGYALFGLLAENITQLSFREWLRKYAMEPLGLRNTLFIEEMDEAAREKIAPPHCGSVPVFASRRSIVALRSPGEALAASGGLWSDIADLAAFAKVFRKNFSPDAREGDVCCNHRVQISPEGHRILARWGMMYGYASFFGTDLDTGVTVVLLRNNTDWPDEFGTEILRALGNSSCQ